MELVLQEDPMCSYDRIMGLTKNKSGISQMSVEECEIYFKLSLTSGTDLDELDSVWCDL